MKQITVGVQAGDMVGADGQTIQQAIDQMHEGGGGRVNVLPGEYTLSDAVRLRPDIHLVGTPGQTCLKRAPLSVSKLICDADRGQRVIYPQDPSRFQVGMGVVLFDRKSAWTQASKPWTVVAVKDDHIQIDRILEEERYEENDGALVNYFPMLQAVQADRCIIEGFDVDGTACIQSPTSEDIEAELAACFHNPPPYFSERIRGPRTALVFHQSSRACQILNVRAHHGTGDGFCFGMASEHMQMRSCQADHNGWYGIHPGSHSAYAHISECQIHDNASDGLYICWGIHHSKFTHNDIHHNGWEHWRSGLSIGHKDTDNLIAHNRIAHNAKYGICIRDKTPQNAPHRCTFQDNVLEDNVSLSHELRELKDKLPKEDDVPAQIRIGKNVRDLTFENNTLTESRKAEGHSVSQAFYQHPDASDISILENQYLGMEEGLRALSDAPA